MEIPLVLRARKDGVLVYSISALFRAAMAAILAVLAAALLIDGEAPGAIGWVATALVALAALYEERWSFDPAAGRIVHRAGLVFLARRTTITLDDVVRFRITPFVRGTLPGSADEVARNAAALAGGSAPANAGADDGHRRRAAHKRPYLCLSCETADGSGFFIEALSARKGEYFKAQASRIAEACRKELIEGYSGS